MNFGIAGDAETCCGGRAYEMGYEADFLAQAEKSMEVIKQSGAKTLVTSCAVCYQVLQRPLRPLRSQGRPGSAAHQPDDRATHGRGQAQAGARQRPQRHLPRPLPPGQARGALDPLARARRSPATGSSSIRPSPTGGGRTECTNLRATVLASLPGVTLTEMDRIKEYAWCGGSCGGVTDSNPEFAEWTATERLEEAASTGAEAIVIGLALEREALLRGHREERRRPQGLRHRRTGRPGHLGRR